MVSQNISVRGNFTARASCEDCGQYHESKEMTAEELDSDGTDIVILVEHERNECENQAVVRYDSGMLSAEYSVDGPVSVDIDGASEVDEL